MTDARSTPTSPLVLVGVDGSPGARAALEVAVEEARLRDARLHVTYAYPVVESLTGTTGEGLYTHLEAEAKALLEEVAAGAPQTDGLSVEWIATPGSPAGVLIEASKDATLLVVGSRGHGGFLGLVMGSVSTQCVHHAHCPVLVVRESR